jgi:hypothetical protein
MLPSLHHALYAVQPGGSLFDGDFDTIAAVYNIFRRGLQ